MASLIRRLKSYRFHRSTLLKRANCFSVIPIKCAKSRKDLPEPNETSATKATWFWRKNLRMVLAWSDPRRAVKINPPANAVVEEEVDDKIIEQLVMSELQSWTSNWARAEDDAKKRKIPKRDDNIFGDLNKIYWTLGRFHDALSKKVQLVMKRSSKQGSSVKTFPPVAK